MGKAYFLSDLHLGATYNDNSRDLERQVVRFLDSIKDEADEIYLMGDILDYWFEYRHVVPKGFVRFFGKIAELSDSGVKITWLIGNHDIWIFDYLPSELGIEVVDGVLEKDIYGVPFSMQHGDAIGGTRKFRLMRSFFRNKVCQKLYSGIHPRFTVGFAKACSRKSRLGYKEGNGTTERLIRSIRHWCKERLEEGDKAKYFVFGHLHKLFLEQIANGRTLIVLPAWGDEGAFGEFDGVSFKMCKFLKNDS